MKYFNILLSSFLFFADAAQALEEYECGVMYEDDATELRTISLDGFRMLDYSDDKEFDNFSDPEGSKIKSIYCIRSSTVPSKYDYMAILSGYPMYIKDNERLVILERANGEYRSRLVDGAQYSKEELIQVQKTLNLYPKTKVK